MKKLYEERLNNGKIIWWRLYNEGATLKGNYIIKKLYDEGIER